MSGAAPAVTRGYSTVPGGQAHWRRAGRHDSAKAPVICLHMVPKSSRSFDRLLPELARDRIALAPDLPGHGASDPLANGERASVDGYARWLWALLDNLALPEPIDLVGYHTGAMVAVAAATRQPERVRRIVNLSAPAFTDDEVAALLDYFRPITLDEAGTRFRVMWERILHFRGPGMDLPMCARSLGDNLLAGEDYEEGHRAAFEHAADYLEELQGLPHPLRVMNIADDLFEQTRRIDPWLNNGKRRDYPQWGNGFLELHPREVAAELRDFLDGDTI